MAAAFPDVDSQQLLRWFDDATVIKGIGYLRRVVWVSDDGGVLVGEVKGTRRAPYQVTVTFADHRPRGRCSCPVGVDCKHVVAALLAWHQHQQVPQAGRARPPQPDPERRSPAPVGAPSRPPDGVLPIGVPAIVSPRPAPPEGSLSPQLQQWLESLAGARDLAQPGATAAVPARASSEALTFLIVGAHPGYVEVLLSKGRVNREGPPRDPGQPWDNLEGALLKPPRFLRPEDLPILRLLRLLADGGRGAGYRLEGETGSEVLRRMVETGRAFVADDGRFGLAGTGPLALVPGAPRKAGITWVESQDGHIRPALDAGASEFAWLPLEPWWYIDLIDGSAGPLELPCSPSVLKVLLTMPPATLDQAQPLREAFARRLPELAPPPALASDGIRVVTGPPVPLLLLASEPAQVYGRAPWLSDGQLDFASLAFDYQDLVVGVTPTPTLLRDRSGALVRLRRDAAFETACQATLERAGLELAPRHLVQTAQPLPSGALTLRSAEGWPAFMHEVVPALRAQGWQIVFDEEFRHQVVTLAEIEGSVQEHADGWFDLELGVRVEGRLVRLEPLLAGLFARDPRWLGGQLESIRDDQLVDLATPTDGTVRLSAARLKPLVRALIDLFQDDERLRISRWDSGRLALLEDSARWVFADGQALAERLRQSAGVQPVAPPAGLQATLRGYQQDGLAWMQYLRAQGLGGVLADDMGLGKTIQTLAHVLTEREQGRLDRPALIVMPTSLIGNWKAEAARFAPQLRVLDLHGPQRHERFADIPRHHLVLTTYALVWRDLDALAVHAYHLLILDEAQFAKNAAGRAAAAVRKLEARHRLCLSGTPLENHLGELWSQFDFLLPGFLGSHRDFARRWRTPIEKGRDDVRARLLARRVRPFLLRRRKEEVAAELPPRVEMVRTVEFEDAQRDLYEIVRSSMQRQVLEAVQKQGLGRSQILLLDALLKLRQVCCDPRLVDIHEARRVTVSAKLELLLGLLPELVEEGRRILVFSQFSSMLGLISDALDRIKLPHVMLTGDTVDRETPIAAFQAGRVPVFLISLKAGGVGLNLTAADSVILYDPWWNPAAERQATDRAHRIGQTSTVFVYRLIATGTVEEKIQAMQQRKAALVEAILGEGQGGSARFTEADIEELFAPLPALPSKA